MPPTKELLADPTLQNDFFIAEKLHMLPSEFRERISNAEYVQLVMYYQLQQHQRWINAQQQAAASRASSMTVG